MVALAALDQVAMAAAAAAAAGAIQNLRIHPVPWAPAHHSLLAPQVRRAALAVMKLVPPIGKTRQILTAMKLKQD
jgi:hypothetical protein